MSSPESTQYPTNSMLEVARRAARSLGKTAALTLVISQAGIFAAGCRPEQSSDTPAEQSVPLGNSSLGAPVNGNSFWVHATAEITRFDGRDLECMAQTSGSGLNVIDCDWKAYYDNPHYVAPASLPRVKYLSEHDEPYGNGKVRCLRYPLSAGFKGETCDWADPAIRNETPKPSQPEKVTVYNGHDKDCIVMPTAPDLREYTCNLDERSSYKAPPTEPRIPAGELTELNNIPWNGGTVTGLAFQQDYALVCATIDWDTVRG